MKYEFGLCTNRFSLCFRFSDSGVGLSRSTANYQEIRKTGRTTHMHTHDHIPPTPSISAMANRVNEFESFIFVQHKCTSAPLSAKGRHVRLTGISQQRRVRPPYTTTRQEDLSREWMPNKAVLIAQQKTSSSSRETAQPSSCARPVCSLSCQFGVPLAAVLNAV